MTEIHVHVADYSADDDSSYLARLDALSRQRQDGGALHGGHIHFIQQKLSAEEPLPFLKAAIKSVLDRVPSVFPYDLPEIVEEDEDYEPTPLMKEAFREINDGLLIPISGYDVIRVILAAREYEQHS